MLQFVMILVMILITLWIFLGNFLVLYAFFRIRQIRSIDNMIIGSLSVTDFLLSISVAPLAIYNLAAPSEYRVFAPCLLWLASDVFLSTVSIWHLCAISFERFYCVVFPLKFMYRRKKRVKLLIILSWLSGFFITIPLVIMAFVDKSTIYRTETQVITQQTDELTTYLNQSFAKPIAAPHHHHSYVHNIDVNRTFKLDFHIEVYKPAVEEDHHQKKLLRSIAATTAASLTKQIHYDYIESIIASNNNCSYYNVYFSLLSVIFSYWFPMVVMLFLTSVTMIVLNRSKYRIDPRVKIKYMLKNKRRSTRLLVNAVAATAAVAHVNTGAVAAASNQGQRMIEMETESVLLPSYIGTEPPTTVTTAAPLVTQNGPKVSFRLNTNLIKSNVATTTAANQLLNATNYCDRRRGYFDFKFNDKIEETDFIDECFDNVDVDDDDDAEYDDDEDDEIDEDVIDDTTTAVAIAAANAIQLDEYTTTGISSSACQAESTIIVDLDTIATTNTNNPGKDDGESKMFSRRSSVMLRNKFNRFKNSLRISTKLGSLLRQSSNNNEQQVEEAGQTPTNTIQTTTTVVNEVVKTEQTLLASNDTRSYSSGNIKILTENSRRFSKSSRRKSINDAKLKSLQKQRKCNILDRLSKYACFSWFFNRLPGKLIHNRSRRNTLNHDPSKPKNQATSKLMQYICKESEAQRRSLIVLIAFVVGYTPLFTLITVSWATNLQLNSNYFVALTWLGYVSSALNPSLYAWMNRNLKRAFYLIVTCKLNKKQAKPPRTSQLLISLNQNNSKAF